MFFARLKLMSKQTENLNLYLTDMETDGNDTFNFDRDLNDNWKKIDEAVNNLSTDLNDKADIDLTNAVPAQSFIDTVIDWVMPDYDNRITFPDAAVSIAKQDMYLEFSRYFYIGGQSFCEVYTDSSASEVKRLYKVSWDISGNYPHWAFACGYIKKGEYFKPYSCQTDNSGNLIGGFYAIKGGKA